MRLVVDENIPGAREAFGGFGELRLLPGRAIDAVAVRDADALVLRSVTRVDAALLEGSRVRFVATATAGVDHVDEAVLAQRGIAFASAPGSNADSVVDYVLSALALAFPGEERLGGRRVGIVGCGQVGGRLLSRLRALGIPCHVHDPFVPGIPEQVPLDEVLGCEVLSLHVPLTRGGAHPTWHLLDGPRLRALPAGALLLNAARGPVVDNAALRAVLAARSDLRAVLDVWEPEPLLDAALLDRCLLGTPHIAGYAADGKRRGAEQVYRAFCAWLGTPPDPGALEALRLPPAGTLDAGTMRWQDAALACYDPRGDDARLRAAVAADPAARGTAFDRLRRDYPERREFSAWRIDAAAEAGVRAALAAAGFGA